MLDQLENAHERERESPKQRGGRAGAAALEVDDDVVALAVGVDGDATTLAMGIDDGSVKE